MFLIRLSICIDFISPPLHQDSGTQIYTKKSITIAELSGQYYLGQKGQSYCSQRGQSCLAKRVKVAWLFQFSGLLKSDDMEHARNLSLQHKGAVRERAALFVSVTTGNDTGRKGKGLKTQTLANRELQGKVGKRFLSDGKVRPQAVSEKIILAGGSGIFPENPAFPEAFAVGPL